MTEYPWQAQYFAAMQVLDSAFHSSANLIEGDTCECISAAENEIYDRLEDSLHGRQHLDSAEWRAINEALQSLRRRRHDLAA